MRFLPDLVAKGGTNTPAPFFLEKLNHEGGSVTVEKSVILTSSNGPKELHEILRTVVGSGAHGLAIEGTDDHDIMGVFISPPEQVMGIAQRRDTYTWRTQPEGVRSGHTDIDLVRYSLHHFLSLATAGNPSILVPLYVSEDHIIHRTKLGRELQELRYAIVSKQAGWRFLGYLDGQFERMQGSGRQSRVPKRPELIDAYGYDTKYASHAARLGLQGIELMTTGRLTLPMPPASRQLVRDVKLGLHSYDEAVTIIHDIQGQLQRIMDEGKVAVPDQPDIKIVNEWMIDAQRRSWKTHPGWR